MSSIKSDLIGLLTSDLELARLNTALVGRFGLPGGKYVVTSVKGEEGISNLYIEVSLVNTRHKEISVTIGLMGPANPPPGTVKVSWVLRKCIASRNGEKRLWTLTGDIRFLDAEEKPVGG